MAIVWQPRPAQKEIQASIQANNKHLSIRFLSFPHNNANPAPIGRGGVVVS
jgi:hypothetical protein